MAQGVGVVLVASSMQVGKAFAWSNQGHVVTGTIAYDDLIKSSPALVANVEAIMANHPDKARFERGLAGHTGEARTRRLFELMARWPDNVRQGPYDHPGWPYWLRLIASPADPAKIPRALMVMTTGQASDAYRLTLATVRDAYAPAADRAIALCWLFHLTGDIQQPLHAGHLISGRFPLSDRAGASSFVLSSDNGKPTNLHAYWDDAGGMDDEDDPKVEAVRIRLEQTWPRTAFKKLSGKADPEASAPSIQGCARAREVDNRITHHAAAGRVRKMPRLVDEAGSLPCIPG